MIGRTFRGMIQLIGGLGAGLAVVMVLAAWRLSTGPISLAYLNPYIERTFSAAHDSFSIRLDDTILTWAGWKRALDIRIVNVRAVATDGKVIARVPELSISLSAGAIMKGLVAPKRIELFAPRLKLVRYEDGRLQVDFTDSTGPSAVLFGGMLDRLLAEPDPKQAMSYLERVNIFDADLTLEDRALGVSWQAPNAQVMLKREGKGIAGEVSFDLQVEGSQTHFTILGDYRPAGRRLDLGIAFDRVIPAVFAGIGPQFEVLNAFDLPVQGTLTASLTVDGAVESIGFDLYAGRGHVALPAPLAQTLRVKEAEVRGRYEAGSGSLEITEIFVDLGQSGELFIPAPAGHRMPLRSVRASGRYMMETAAFELDTLKADLHGPTADLSATVAGVGDHMTVEARGEFHNIPVDEFRRYWPAAWGRDAHDWFVANLSDGMVRAIRAKIKLRADGKGGFAVDSLNGDMTFEGVTVNYIVPMPKIRNVSATATFDTQSYRIAVDRGYSRGLTVTGGTVNVTGLDAYDQYLDLDLVIEGPFRKAMELIDHRPFGYAAAVGIRPGKTAGTATTRLKMNFIIEKTLTPDQIEISATSELRDVTIAEAVMDQEINADRLSLSVNRQGLDVTGRVKLGTIPATLIWRENFASGAEFRSRYLVSGRLENQQRSTELGLDFPPFWGEVVDGAMDVNLRYTVYPDDRRRLEAKVDLKDTALALKPFGWSKEKGVIGSAEVDLSLTGDGLRGESRFTVNADDLKILGGVHYAPDGSGLDRIELDRFAYGRTDLRGVLTPRTDGGWTIHARGESFDFAPLWDEFLAGKSELFAENEEQADGPPRFTITGEMAQVWLAAERQARRVSGTLDFDGKIWRNIDIKGVTGIKQPFTFRLQPGKNGNRVLSVQAQDAGIALRTFGIYNNMVGGTLTVKGVIADGDPEAPLKGQVRLKDYRVVDAPAVVHFVSILAVTGLLEALQGEGLSFSTLEAPFTYRDGTITVKDARATGLSLGFTAAGTIDTVSQKVNMKGTVVPAYAINSALGNIPIIGKILTGGEKGGGVFAATYQMTGPMADPKVSVDALSALAPGFLREVFGALSKGGTPIDLPQLEEAQQ